MPSSALSPVDHRFFAITRRLLAALLFIATPVIAAAQSLITLRADSTRRVIAPSSKLTVPLILDMSAAGGTNLASLTTGVSFGAFRLTFDSVRTAGFGSLTANVTNAASGFLTLAVTDTTGTTATQTVATMYFTTSATEGGTTIAFNPSEARSVAGTDILSLVRRRALGVCVAPGGKWGDVNGDSVTTPLGDGSVNIIDAQQIARFSVGLTVSNRPGLVARGDVTNDGSVNIIDAQQIARFSVALSASVRVNTSAAAVPLVESVSLVPSVVSLTVGDKVQLSAAVNATGPGCVDVIYSSSDPTKVVVDSTGLVTAVAAGTVSITATSGGKSGQATVTVQLTLGTVPANLRYVKGDSQFVAGGDYLYPPTVRVVDSRGWPVYGVPVTFTGNGAKLRPVPGGAAASVLIVNSDSSGIAAPAGWYNNAAFPDPMQPIRTTGTVTATSGALNSVVFTGTKSDGQVAATACALTRIGTPYCWGEYDFMILNPTSTDTSAGSFPVQVPGGIALAKLPRAINGEFQCGLTAAGAAYCWGWNGAGQLGDGTFTSSAAMRPVAGGLSFTQITTGQTHACGLTAAGAAYCWGLNGHGELGDASTYSRASNVPVPVGGGRTYTALSAGFSATCGIVSNGDTYCWGAGGGALDSTGGTYATPRKVAFVPAFKDIAVTPDSFCGLTPAGAAYCWGSNAYGQLGDGSVVSRSTTAQPVVGGLSFSEIFGSSDFYCGKTAAGLLYCWGRNYYGQLGVGDQTDRRVPTFTGLTVTTGLANYFGACFKVQGGIPWCWGAFTGGDGVHGLNTGVFEPTPGPVKWVEGAAGVAATVLVNAGNSQVAAVNTAVGVAPSVMVRDFAGAPAPGATVTFAVASGGGSVTGAVTTTNASGIATVGSWVIGATNGANTLTATVDGIFPATFTAYASSAVSLVRVQGDSQVVAPAFVAAVGPIIVKLVDANNIGVAGVPVTFSTAFGTIGDASSATVLTVGDGTATMPAWDLYGSNYTFITVVTASVTSGAVPALGIQAFPVTTSTGSNHSCLLTASGAAYCQGLNASGQLGDGTTANKSLPTAVSGGQIFTMLAEGRAEHSCGITPAGAAYCWGRNDVGQVGDGALGSRTVPTLVSGGLVFTSIAVHYLSTCGIAGGELYCWGWTGYGRFDASGVGTPGYSINRTSSVPHKVAAAGTGLTRVALGFGHQCVLGGVTLKCWGVNASGQIGDGFRAAQSLPVTLPGSWTTMDLADELTCGVTTAAGFACWGASPIGPSTLAPVAGFTGIVQVRTLPYTVCLRDDPGAVRCWGSNFNGEAGSGIFTFPTDSREFVAVPNAGGPYTSLVVGGTSHFCGVVASGQPYCWGQNDNGQLGTGGPTSPQRSPIAVRNWPDAAATGAVAMYATSVVFSQTAGVLSPLPTVIVVDKAGVGVAGITVTFTAGANGGSVTGGTVVTNASGIATLGGWTLGTTSGTMYTVTATSPGLATVLFRARAP